MITRIFISPYLKNFFTKKNFIWSNFYFIFDLKEKKFNNEEKKMKRNVLMKNRNNNKKESKKQNVMRATKSNKKNEGEIRK